jgi:hypothetical protein
MAVEVWNGEDSPPPGEGWTYSPGRGGSYTRNVPDKGPQVLQQIAQKLNIPAGQIETVMKDVGSGRSGQQTVGYYSYYDPATNIVTNFDPNGNLIEQGQRGSGSKDFLTQATQPLQNLSVEVAKNAPLITAVAIATMAPMVAASIAPAFAALGAYAPIAAQAVTSIAVQVAQGVPIEKATENALVNAAVSGATGEVQKQIGKVISSPGVTNAITSTVSSGLATAAKGGSQADVEKAMTAGLVSSGASTAFKEAVDASSPIASAAVGGAAGGAVTGGTEGAVIGGLQSAAGALGKELAPSPTSPSAPTPAPEPVSQAEPKNVEELLAAVDAAQKKDYVSSSTAFAGAGLISAAAEETAVLLARLAATPAGQQVLREAATTSDRIRTAIVASGILSAGALTGFIGGQSLVPKAQTEGSTRNPGFDLIPTKGGDPGTATQARRAFAQTDPRRVDTSTPSSGDVPVKVETQRVAQILNIPLADAVKLENVNPVLYNFFANSDPKSFTPADTATMSSTNQRILDSILAGQNINEGSLPDTGKYTTTIQSSPVAGLDITADQSQAEAERLARQGQPTTTSPQDTAQAPAESATVMQVNPSTGEAIAIKSTGEIFTVTVDPNTKSGTAIKVSASTAPVTKPKINPAPTPTPTPTPTPSPEPSPVPAPEPAPSPTPEPAPAPFPAPSPSPTPVPAPTPSPTPTPSPEPSPAPAPAPAPEPITPPRSVVETPLAPAPISEKDKQLIDLIRPEPPATKDGAPSEPVSVPSLTKEQIASGEYFYNAPGGFAKDEEIAPEQPVYDYDPKAKIPFDVFTKTVLSPKTKSAAALGQALGTTGLASYRGAGEIEVGTGKARRKVWNEESLKLKDALGV